MPSAPVTRVCVVLSSKSLISNLAPASPAPVSESCLMICNLPFVVTPVSPPTSASLYCAVTSFVTSSLEIAILFF